MKITRAFVICCILACAVLLFLGCSSENDGEKLQSNKGVETGMIAGIQYNNDTIIHPKTLYQINDLETFFKGKTFADCTSEESILSLSELASRFPNAYLRFYDYSRSKMLYLAFPVKEGGTFVATLLLPLDMLESEKSSFLVDSAFWVHSLPSKEEFSMLKPGINTLSDIEMLCAPMLRGLFSSGESVSYYLLNDGICAVVTIDSVSNSLGADPVIHSVEYISVEDSPFSAFLKSDMEDSNWSNETT